MTILKLLHTISFGARLSIAFCPKSGQKASVAYHAKEIGSACLKIGLDKGELICLK